VTLSDEVRSDEHGSDTGVPVGVDPSPPTTALLTEAWAVIRILALLALMLVLAGFIATALQFVMGLLGFTAS
jgi:hypothetical protein